MSYQKQNFSDGEVLQASHLNFIEDGIVHNEKQIETVNKTIEELTKELENLGKDFNIENITKELEDLKKKIEELENSEEPNEEIKKQIEEINNTIELIQKEVASNKESLQDKLSNQQVNKLINDKYKEIVQLIPPEEIWRGSGVPPTNTHHIFGIDYSSGKAYYKDEENNWKLIAGNGDKVNSIIDITRLTREKISISFEEKSCEIGFKWTCSVAGDFVKDKANISIIVNNVEKEKFKEVPGTIIKDIKKYLGSGTNKVVVKIKDGYGSEEQIEFSISVIAITISATGYKQNEIISLKTLQDKNSNNIGINVTVNGIVIKTLHMLIDGIPYDFGGAIPEFGAGKQTQTIYIPKQTHGSHLIQLYATHTIKEEGQEDKVIYSNSVFYDTIWWDDVTPQTTAIIASSFSKENGSQYEVLKIPYYLYKPGYSSCDVRFGIKVDNEIKYINSLPQKRDTQIEAEWVVSSDKTGENTFIIEAGVFNSETEDFIIEDTREFSIDLAFQETPPLINNTNLLSINFKADKTDSFDKNNRDKWQSTSNEIPNLNAEFVENTFDWTNNGWELVDERPALKIANGAKLNIPYPIFSQAEINNTSTEFSEQGVTIEIDVSFDEISDSNRDFLVCYDEDKNKGIKISPSRALLTNGEGIVQVQYASSESKKYNNSMRISFVVCPIETRYKADGTENDKVGSMYIYINGIGAAASEYRSTDFKHTNIVSLNSEGCAVHLHSFKMYRKNLEPLDILNNWMYDMNPSDQINAYKKNWIYVDGQISYDLLVNQIPCMTIIGRLPTYKGDKTPVDIRFEGTENNLYDFTIDAVEIDVQGTSSQYYPVKNWKFKKKDYPFKMNNGDLLDKYPLADDQIPAKVFCLKADYMETSSTHNTVTANFANSMYDKDKKTPPQKPKNNTASEIERAEKTRTTIYGRPIIVFYQDTIDSELRFGGKYNFNYDKGAEDVFGFFEDKDYEVIDCVEFRENRNDRCLLKVSDYTEVAEGLTAADLDEFDERSWIQNSDGTVTSAYEWGRSFEFRYYYHKDETEESKSYEYLKPATDWIVETDFSKANPNKILESPYIVEKGVANFLYDKNLNVIKYIDQNGNERRALDLGYLDPEKSDYAIEENKVYIYNENNEPILTTYYSLAWDDKLNKEVYKFEKDTENYRLTKFKNELPEHFNEHYCLMYFELMEMLGMIDSSTKNMFWATWGERHPNHPIESGDKVVIWYPIFYDMDTMMGINNTGKMNIPYNVEFDSPLEGSDTGFAFNGYDNVFWNNFRKAYATDLNSLFRDKVSEGIFSLDNMLKLYEDHSEKFSESIYNADGQLKIIDSYFKGYTTNEGEKFPDWLHVYQGDRYYYRRFWLPNRFNYLLSKNFAGNYANDFISMRLNDPRTKVENQGKDIEVDYDFDIITWKDQYTRIKYGGRSVVERCTADEPIKIKAPSNSYNDTETGIFGASNLKSIGKLSNKYASTLELSSARNLLELDIGSDDPNYTNPGLNKITFGSNSMLRKVNIQNCNGLNSTLGLSACPNITKINASGTNIIGVELPQKGIVETLLLPKTIKELIVTNQPKLKKYENIEGKEVGFFLPKDSRLNEKNETVEFYNLETLRVENTPNINTKDLVEKSINEKLGRLCLKEIDWTKENQLMTDELLFLIKSKGENGTLNGLTSTDTPVLEGECYIDSVKDYLLDRLNLYFNGISDINLLPPIENRRLKIRYREKVTTFELKFLKEKRTDGKEEIIDIGLPDNRIVYGDFAEFKGTLPQREEDWDRTYQFWKWYTEDENGEITYYSLDELKNLRVVSDMTLYPAYIDKPKEFKFIFTFLNQSKQEYTLATFNNLILDQNNELIQTNYNLTQTSPNIIDDESGADATLRYTYWRLDTDENNKIAENTEFKVPENSDKYVFNYVVGNYSVDRKYRFTFVDWDNSVIQKEIILYAGDNLKAIVPDDRPQYEDVKKVYTFEGWSLNGVDIVTIPDEVGGDVYNFIYIATYSSVPRPYTVSFYNYDGTLLQTGKVGYGSIPEYTAELPTKPRTQQFSYKFIPWNLTEVQGDQVYIASYEEIVNKYTVTWQNEDGTLIYSEKVEYGKIPAYNYDKYGTPQKLGDAQFTWYHLGWHIEISEVTEDIIYKATYYSEINKYKVIWKNYDGNILETDEYVPYGNMPEYNGELPTKPDSANGQYEYKFLGWDADVTVEIENSLFPTEPVRGNVVYTAVYQELVKQYTYTFVDWNGEVIFITQDWGTAITEPSFPKRTGYTFTGWDKEFIETIKENMTYTAQYSINQYTITFVGYTDFEGNDLKEIKITQDYNTLLIPPTAITRMGYDFIGWDRDIPERIPAENVTITAQYEIQRFTIRFINDDGTPIRIDENVPYGSTLTPPTPKKTGYDFAGWKPALSSVIGDAEYTATFTPIIYNITWEFGAHSEITKCAYDSVPEIPSQYAVGKTYNTPDGFTYNFLSWEQPTIVRGDATYRATVSGSGSIKSRFTKYGIHGSNAIKGNKDSAAFQNLLNGTGGVSTSSSSGMVIYGFDFRNLAKLNNVTITNLGASVRGKSYSSSISSSSIYCKIKVVTDINTSKGYTNNLYSSDLNSSHRTVIGSTVSFEGLYSSSTVEVVNSLSEGTEWAKSNINKLIDGFSLGTFGLEVWFAYHTIYDVYAIVDFTFG